MTPEQVIKKPIFLTEKSGLQRETDNQYTFEVALKSNKIDIRKAVEKLFEVNVEEVRTMIVRGHMRRMGRGQAKTPNWKKAIVKLSDGDTIDYFEGA